MKAIMPVNRTFWLGMGAVDFWSIPCLWQSAALALYGERSHMWTAAYGLTKACSAHGGTPNSRMCTSWPDKCQSHTCSIATHGLAWERQILRAGPARRRAELEKLQP